MLTFIRKMPGVSRCSMYSQDNGLVASVLTIPRSSSIQSCPPPTAHRGVTHIWGIKKRNLSLQLHSKPLLGPSTLFSLPTPTPHLALLVAMTAEYWEAGLLGGTETT